VNGLDPKSFAAVEQELSLLLRRARGYLLTVARDVHPDLDASAYSTLLFITTRPAPRAVDLADYLGMNKGAVSRQIAQLERLGLVQRQPSRHDARAQLLAVTEQGRNRFTAARQARSQRIQAQLGEWEHDDILQFAHLLSRFNDLLA
jgi:DNA-binding MarR family transcriptional regulator